MQTPSKSPSLTKTPGLFLSNSIYLLILLYPLASFCQLSVEKGPVDLTVLEPGKPIERELPGGQKHSYQIMLTERQFAAVDLDARGISATITVFDTAGEVIITYPAEPGKQTVDIVAETTGRYRIDIESKPSGAPAGTYTIRPPEPRPAPDEELWRHQARRLSNKANALIGAGKYDEALVLAEKALPLREKALGPESVGVANSLHMLASLYHAKGDYPKAVSSLLRAMVIYEKTSGPASDGLFRTLGNLGGVYFAMGDLDKAEQFMRRGLEIQEKLTGADHPLVAYTLNNLALVYSERGDYGKAESLFQRALAIREKALGPNDPLLTGPLTNLAGLSQKMGDYIKAERFGQRALAVIESNQGPDHPLSIEALINLGNVQYLTRELGKAETFYQRALQISMKTLGPEHPNVAHSLNNLAEIHRDRQEFAQAEKLYEQALTIVVKSFGENHTRVAAQLNNLGNLYRDQGDYPRAESFYQRALASREKLLGPEHPDVVSTLANTALSHMARGNFAEAAAFQSRVNAISERNADLNLRTGSERQKLAYLDLMTEQIDRAITLNVSFAPDNSAARTLAVTTVLQRKGLVQDALSDSLAALQHQMSTTDAELLDRFNKLTSQLARLVLGGPQKLTTEEHQNRVNGLREERENLEAEISRRSAEFRARSQAVTIGAVRAALPENAALLEFVAYNRLLPKGVTAKERRGESRYVVYIIRSRGDVKWKDLGEAKPIDEAVNELRRALRDPKRNDVKQLARALEERVMRPVRTLAGNATQLLVSPDGALNLVPFEALVDEQNRYLIERYSLSYLTSGRDLLRMQVKLESNGKPTVVANPSFGEPVKEELARSGSVSKPTAARDRLRNVTAARDLSEVYFAPLSGTAQEARTIQTLFPEASLLTGAQATESALKGVAAPRLLHIATHGFFLDDAGTAAAGELVATRGIDANVKIGNPLLRSGLALAGANRRGGVGDDGILTALEASGLNLWGTKLVVLSACDTGLGEVRNGEGVYGLRRAFVLAGAESLVMSMWPVSDYVTRELMTNYYKNLKKSMGRGESLRQVQLEMIKRPNRRHPFYWASFIQTGEWANLDGKR